MRTYIALIYYDCKVHRERIEAKNMAEAQTLALRIGHKLTGYGQTGFLEHVTVRREIKK